MSADLIMDIQAMIAKLNTSIKMLRQTGTEYAEAERDYKILLSQESLRLKDGGMAVTLIDKVVYGKRNVAEARFRRDVAETTYKANLESINAIKLQIRVLDNQIAREWGTPQAS